MLASKNPVESSNTTSAGEPISTRRGSGAIDHSKEGFLQAHIQIEMLLHYQAPLLLSGAAPYSPEIVDPERDQPRMRPCYRNNPKWPSMERRKLADPRLSNRNEDGGTCSAAVSENLSIMTSIHALAVCCRLQASSMFQFKFDPGEIHLSRSGVRNRSLLDKTSRLKLAIYSNIPSIRVDYRGVK